MSPVLGVSSGIVSIDDTDYTRPYGGQLINILKFRIKVEPGCLGFSGIEEGTGIPSKLFDVFREQVSQMAYSFHRGMLLENCDFYWYESEEINLEDLEKENKNYMEEVSEPGKNTFIYRETKSVVISL